MRERLGEGLVGCAELLVAASVEDERTRLEGLARELGGEAGLPDARLPGHEHEPALAPRRCAQCPARR